MQHLAVEPRGVSAVVVQGDIFQIDTSRSDMHRVGCPVGGVGEVYFHRNRVGQHIPLEVDIFEIAEHTRPTRCIAADVGGESLHIRLQKSHRLAIDAESEVERIALDVYAPLHGGAAAAVVDIGVENHPEVFRLEARLDQRVAEDGAVVADILHIEARCLKHRHAREKVGGVELPGGLAAEHHGVDAQ